jgi:hypothetical protein
VPPNGRAVTDEAVVGVHDASWLGFAQDLDGRRDVERLVRLDVDGPREHDLLDLTRVDRAEDRSDVRGPRVGIGGLRDVVALRRVRRDGP